MCTYLYGASFRVHGMTFTTTAFCNYSTIELTCDVFAVALTVSYCTGTGSTSELVRSADSDGNTAFSGLADTPA